MCDIFESILGIFGSQKLTRNTALTLDKVWIVRKIAGNLEITWFRAFTKTFNNFPQNQAQ